MYNPVQRKKKERVNAAMNHAEIDCGFQKENKWFRYRAAAIIVEDGCVLFAGNEIDNYYYSIGGGVAA